MSNQWDNPLPPPVSRSPDQAYQQANQTDPSYEVHGVPGVTPPIKRAPIQGQDKAEFQALGPPSTDERGNPRSVDVERTLAAGPPPPGSKDYVAGQPVDEEEASRTEYLARAKADAAGPDVTTPEGIKRAREEREKGNEL
jgi:hypothetical protein